MIICIPLDFDSTAISTIVVGFLAFLATILAARYAANSALLNARQNSVTDARLKWLADFKELVSSYLTNCVSAYVKQRELASYSKMGEEFERRAKEKNQTYDSKEFAKYVLDKKDQVLPIVAQMDSQYHLIRLNLNPNAEGIEYILRLKLIDFNREIQKYDQGETAYDFNDDINDIIEICNHLFKLEWEKAKRGEIGSFDKTEEKNFETEFLKKYRINKPNKENVKARNR